MKLAYLISTAADLSDTSATEAWIHCAKPELYSVIVGTKQASVARTLKINGVKPPHIWVNPNWVDEWMISSQYASCFSESCG